MKHRSLICLFVLLLLLGHAVQSFSQEKERVTQDVFEDNQFGFTVLGRYTYRDWSTSSQSKGGDFEFDSFRIYGSTKINDWFSVSAQYRFYDGWKTPHHFWLTYHSKRAGDWTIGQVWAPFGIGWQPFDDWGNLAYYVGLQDDYDMGITWSDTFGRLQVDAGFLKNQQLSSSSLERYDADIYSGDCAIDDAVCQAQKSNEETNQLNLRVEYDIPLGDDEDRGLQVGLSGMWGQLYNLDTDDTGDRYAGAAHVGVHFKRLFANFQFTGYEYTQKLPESATQADEGFLNVSLFNYAYEIPSKAFIYAGSIGYNILPDDKLMIHTNYSYLTGGASEADSSLWTVGLRSFGLFANRMDIFLESYYGKNDPILSGDASGYGRDADSSDLRVDLRFYFHFDVFKEIKNL